MEVEVEVDMKVEEMVVIVEEVEMEEEVVVVELVEMEEVEEMVR